MIDVSPFIKSKSDQLNADDLVAGPITVQVREVRKTGGEQPIAIVVSGGHMPVKPSKTMLRVLSAAWGTDASKWAGRWMRLYRDGTVKWGGKDVGGVRVSALSHIAEPMMLALAEAKGKKKAERVGVLREADCRDGGAPTASLDGLLSDAGLTLADVDRWLATKGKPETRHLSDEQRAAFASWLAGQPATIDAIRNMTTNNGGEE